MTHKEIIAMAKEAGFGMQMGLLDHPFAKADAQRLYQQLARFAALVADKEREACAQYMESCGRHGHAAAIRARGITQNGGSDAEC